MSLGQFIIPFMIGICAGILSGLGIGGGTLLILYLTLVVGIPQLQAQGINLLYFVCACTPALIIHIHKKRVDIRKTLPISIIGMVVAVVAANFANKISVDLIRRLFGVIVTYAGATQLIKAIPKHKKIIRDLSEDNPNNSEE